MDMPKIDDILAQMLDNPKGIRQLVSEVVADLKESGAPVPQPLASRPYSGRFLVRIPPEVHRELAMEAAEAGVSLNRLASARLAR